MSKSVLVPCSLKPRYVKARGMRAPVHELMNSSTNRASSIPCG